ncbi:class I SAM-dependent methyltransferase [Nocardioides dongxiaopingii]|uniref:methyltransferase domain-containing protein n=1 Tax=Nocardioides TaxID=1839 RepID=UPI00110EA900|nr:MULTISPECIES: methyltransferase domain-containing protein [Nocardioides]QCW50380.1 class I SAM-dependent methyltransferase [Nocardioides sp. S-1144]
MIEQSFSTVFTHALRGQPTDVVGLDDTPGALPVDTWRRAADEHDQRMLDLCHGPTIDVGCGPGRMVAALVERGVPALGIDVVPEAVRLTRARGVPALEADVFGSVPDEGTWGTALLADGNVGIGGDPVALLARLRDLVAPGGRIVAELAAPGVRTRTMWATIEAADTRSRRFRWAIQGVDDVDVLARRTGLQLDSAASFGGRWCAVLTRTSARPVR